MVAPAYRTPGYEVKLLTWESDQNSDWHDHGGSSGAFRVTSGSLSEQPPREGFGSSIDSAIFAPGDYRILRHRLRARRSDYETGEPAVSIHAYSPPLSGLTYYERTRFRLRGSRVH